MNYCPQGLFKAFLKKLGEPIKLYGNDSQLVSVDDIEILNEPKNQKKDDSKKKVFETDQKTEGSFITNWYPSQEQKKEWARTAYLNKKAKLKNLEKTEENEIV